MPEPTFEWRLIGLCQGVLNECRLLADSVEKLFLETREVEIDFFV